MLWRDLAGRRRHPAGLIQYRGRIPRLGYAITVEKPLLKGFVDQARRDDHNPNIALRIDAAGGEPFAQIVVLRGELKHDTKNKSATRLLLAKDATETGGVAHAQIPKFI